jgi:hypothetical protein
MSSYNWEQLERYFPGCTHAAIDPFGMLVVMKCTKGIPMFGQARRWIPGIVGERRDCMLTNAYGPDFTPETTLEANPNRVAEIQAAVHAAAGESVVQVSPAHQNVAKPPMAAPTVAETLAAAEAAGTNKHGFMNPPEQAHSVDGGQGVAHGMTSPGPSVTDPCRASAAFTPGQANTNQPLSAVPLVQTPAFPQVGDHLPPAPTEFTAPQVMTPWEPQVLKSPSLIQLAAAIVDIAEGTPVQNFLPMAKQVIRDFASGKLQ